MTHYSVDPPSECSGRLDYQEHHTERVYDRNAHQWVEVIRSVYQCHGCGDYVTVDRRLIDAPEGNVPIVELRFHLV
jgi:hypothetical protein